MSGVHEYLQGRSIAFLVLSNPEATSLDETACRHGIPPADLVRVVVVAGRLGKAMMVIPAARELDLDLAREALADPEATRVSDLEMRLTYGCVDAMPPLGLYYLLPMYVDLAVAELDQVVFAAERPQVAICLEATELFRDDPVVIAPLTPESAALLEREPAEDPMTALPVHLAV